jgi:thiol-disulfide isomerase/thioredoxin
MKIKLPLIAAICLSVLAAAGWFLINPGFDKANAGNTPNPALLQEFAKGEMANFTLTKSPAEVSGLVFADEKGQSRKFSDFHGKLILVNFWATWCIPCREEMPSLDALKTAFNGSSFDVVPISLDRDGAKPARKFMNRVKADHLALYLDPAGRTGRSMGAFGLPLTVLIGGNGKEIGRLVGPAKWSSPEAEALIRAALAQKP